MERINADLAQAQKANPNFSEEDLYIQYKGQIDAIGDEIQALWDKKFAEGDYSQLKFDNSQSDELDRLMDLLSLNNSKSQLVHASAAHDALALLELLKDPKIDINQTDYNGYTALYLAAEEDEDAIAKILIKAGATVDALSKSGRSPLHAAAYNNSPKLAKTLIDAKAQINLQDKDGETPLYMAVEYGALGIVRELIEAGANVNLPNNQGSTPLAIAKLNNADAIVEMLTAAGGVEDASSIASSKPVLDAIKNLETQLAAQGDAHKSLTVKEIVALIDAKTKA